MPGLAGGPAAASAVLPLPAPALWGRAMGEEEEEEGVAGSGLLLSCDQICCWERLSHPAWPAPSLEQHPCAPSLKAALGEPVCGWEGGSRDKVSSC